MSWFAGIRQTGDHAPRTYAGTRVADIAGMRLAFALLAFSALGACATPPVDEWVSIDQGVYGSLTSYDDTGGGSSVVSNEDVYIDDPARQQTLFMTKSNDDGYYEIKLEPGSYAICLYGSSCSFFAIATGERVRMDFEAGPGGGMWRMVEVQ